MEWENKLQAELGINKLEAENYLNSIILRFHLLNNLWNP